MHGCRTRGKRCAQGQTPQATSDSSSVVSLKSLSSVDSLKTAHHMVEEERASLKNASCEDKENIHNDPCSLLEGKVRTVFVYVLLVYMWSVHVVCTCGLYMWSVRVVCKYMSLWSVRVDCVQNAYTS